MGNAIKLRNIGLRNIWVAWMERSAIRGFSSPPGLRYAPSRLQKWQATLNLMTLDWGRPARVGFIDARKSPENSVKSEFADVTHMYSAPITYIEIPTRSLSTSKAFFNQAFGWMYRDLNNDYCYITNAGLPCAFYRSNKIAQGSILLVLQVQQLETAQANVIAAGGQIIKPTFNFPGGHRFHFSDACGNEFAVWAVKNVDGHRETVQMG